MVLDLEKAVRISTMGHPLNKQVVQSGGLHLLRKAYDDALMGLCCLSLTVRLATAQKK